MRSWKFSKSLSSVMFFRKGSSVLIPGFDSSLLRDVNSTVSPLKWGTVTVLPMNLCGSWRTPPGVTVEMRHSNSFTHEPLWVVTHTACVNAVSCPQRLSFSPGNLFWDSFTNRNTGNYLRHGIDVTTNQRLSPTFRGNGNTIIVGDSQTSLLPSFSGGGETSVHRLKRR